MSKRSSINASLLDSHILAPLIIIFLSFQILHNKELNHLVSVCSESVIRVWEVESGKQVSQVTEPHGPGVEVTCVAFHKSGYRMATGALDGRSNYMVIYS